MFDAFERIDQLLLSKGYEVINVKSNTRDYYNSNTHIQYSIIKVTGIAVEAKVLGYTSGSLLHANKRKVVIASYNLYNNLYNDINNDVHKSDMNIANMCIDHSKVVMSSFRDNNTIKNNDGYIGRSNVMLESARCLGYYTVNPKKVNGKNKFIPVSGAAGDTEFYIGFKCRNYQDSPCHVMLNMDLDKYCIVSAAFMYDITKWIRLSYCDNELLKSVYTRLIADINGVSKSETI